MGQALSKENDFSEVTLLKIAREIAMDLHPIETILEHHKITDRVWDAIKSIPHFQALLQSEIAAWQSASNTSERLKLKAAAMCEEWLPEANTRVHDSRENLTAKVETMKLVSRLAGYGVSGAGIEGGGAERIQVTINLGQDQTISISKELPPKVIEADVLEN